MLWNARVRIFCDLCLFCSFIIHACLFVLFFVSPKNVFFFILLEKEKLVAACSTDGGSVASGWNLGAFGLSWTGRTVIIFSFKVCVLDLKQSAESRVWSAAADVNVIRVRASRRTCFIRHPLWYVKQFIQMKKHNIGKKSEVYSTVFPHSSLNFFQSIVLNLCKLFWSLTWWRKL